MPNALITSETVTAKQINQCARVVGDAAEKAVSGMLGALADKRELNRASMQIVLAAGGRIGSAIAKVVAVLVRQIVSGIVGPLKRISAEPVIIAATAGTETLATAIDLFGSNIDSDFVNWGCDGTESPTLATPVEIYEQKENADYRTMFGAFGQNLDQLCLTTPQIKSFIASHADKWLREDGWAVFLFLFKVKAKKNGQKDEFFVAGVRVSAAGRRSAGVGRFAYGCLWNAESRDRVVVPQLALGQ